MAAELVRYDAMCQAIAEAYEVDEVKSLRDKALAIEVYARQAKNVEAERQACEIRLRAERRWGQLYRAAEKAKNQHVPVDRCDQQKTLADMGVSKHQSSRWQQLADIEDELFEDEVRQPGASTAGMLSKDMLAKLHGGNGTSKAKHPIDLVDEQALWLCGRLQDFRRHGLLDRDPATICNTMLPTMRETMRELLWPVIIWLQGVEP